MSKLRSDLIMLLAAAIWGFAFVAQRVGMEHLGPFSFNGIRFLLGIMVLIPFLFFKRPPALLFKPNDKKVRIIGSLAAGLFLFGGVALQQLGLQTTTAGKAGFITGLYVVFVPVAGVFFRQKITFTVWAGVILSAMGLYLLSVKESLTIETGDLLVLLCAVSFTGHVLTIGWITQRMDSYHLAIVQFSVCAILNLIFAFSIEEIRIADVAAAAVPLLYGGLLSVGIAYTLQIVAQKHAHPAYASIILSLEAVFAAIGGWLILDEYLTNRALLGCAFMLAGMIVVQIKHTSVKGALKS